MDSPNIQSSEKVDKGFSKTLKRIKKLNKKTKIILGIILIIILVVGFFIFKPKAPTYEWTTVQRGEVIQEVSVNGKVEATDEIDLRFKTSGTIDKILVKVGDKVKKGVVLARLDTGGVYSQYLQAQATYNQAKAKLDQLLAGASSEEIKVAEQVVENAKIALDDARDKAENDLNQDYNSALVYLVNSSSKYNKALADLKDMEKIYFYRSTILETTFKEKRSLAENAYFAVSILDTNGEEEIDLALTKMWSGLQKVIDALDYAKTAMADSSIRENVSSTDRTTIDTDITNINTAFSNINTAQSDIADQKITNQTNINSAESTYKKAQVDLEKLKAVPRSVDVAVYQADVDRYGANLEEYSQKLKDASIVAPFDGEIAKIDGKIGEVITAGEKITITLLSPNGFEVKADVPETDIGEVTMNNPVGIVLDAFPEEVYQGQILEINPAETIIEGVVYYQIKVLFTEPNQKLRSGMGGDVTIRTNKKENVLYVPQRAVITKNGDKIVRVLNDKKIEEVKVITGLRGSKGEIEIISGLEENDEVITFMKK